MTEPTTEAGKRLLECRTYHWALCPVLVGDGECDCNLPDAVAAIEAEARKQAGCLCSDPFPILPDGDCFRARHDAYCRANSPVRIAERARIAEAVTGLRSHDAYDDGGLDCVSRAAVLAIVEPCEHDWQRSGPVSDGHLFCPDCGSHEDER